MRIIGIADGKYEDKKYLVEVTLSELRKVAGGEYFDDLKVGDEIRVNEIYNWLVQLRRKSNQVNEAQQQIKALADLMGTVETIVAKALKREESEDELNGGKV